MHNTGTVFKALSGFFYIHTEEGDVCCRARGQFKHKNANILVGDHVVYECTDPGYGIITQILERKNSFLRPAVANVDAVVIIASESIPITDPYLIDRVTVTAAARNCEAVVCINKCDLYACDRLFDIYKKSGFKTIKTSAVNGEGIKELSDYRSGKICVFTGNSGVGKSSVLNALNPDFNIQTGDISQKLGRGRHTTRHVELFNLNEETMIIDTPGFSSFDTDQNDIIKKDDLAGAFIDFTSFIGNCRYADCAHINEPDCAVKSALSSGSICRSRYDSYVRLYEIAKNIKEWENNK